MGSLKLHGSLDLNCEVKKNKANKEKNVISGHWVSAFVTHFIHSDEMGAYSIV